MKRYDHIVVGGGISGLTLTLLLAINGKKVLLLEKGPAETSRPAAGEDWEAFISRETGKYRPQLLAYREMAARAQGIEPPEAIRLGVYFTASRKVVEM